MIPVRLLDLSINIGQISIGFEADKPEILQKHAHLMTFGQRFGLTVIDEQTAV